MGKNKVLVEVIYEGDHCIPCVYMAELVETVVSKFGEAVEWRKVDLRKMEGAIRFAKLLGFVPTTGNRKKAPVPSIFINEKCIYTQIPPAEELEKTIIKALK